MLKIFRITMRTKGEISVEYVAARDLHAAIMQKGNQFGMIPSTYKIPAIVPGEPMEFTLGAEREESEIVGVEEDPEKTEALKAFLAEVLMP